MTKIKQLGLIAFMTFLMGSCIEEPANYPNTYKGNFQSLWTIVDKKYCYLDYKKINWDSVYRAFEPRVDTVSNQYAFFDLMSAMLAELKDGHVNLYSSFDVSRYWKWYQDYPANFNSDVILKDRYLGSNYRIAGGFKYKTIANGKVGYMYYGDFSNTFSDTNIAYIFKAFSACKGIIIDVRDNGGGYLSSAEQLASYFYPEEKVTGYMCHKTGNGHSDFSEPIELKTPSNANLQWQRPVIVLTNRMSYSATNSFVSRMKMAPKATIIGDKTGGGGGMPLSSEIPNGWMVRFSACPMFDANMKHIEWGIDPDMKVDMDIDDELKGVDTIIEAAVSLIVK